MLIGGRQLTRAAAIVLTGVLAGLLLVLLAGVAEASAARSDGLDQAPAGPAVVTESADTGPVTAAENGTGLSAEWLGTLHRGLSLLGVSGAVGAIFCWLWVIRPAVLVLSDSHRERVWNGVYRLGVASVGVCLLGSLIALGAWTASEGTVFSPASVWSVLTGTESGALWILRILLLAALAVLVSWRSFWHEPPARRVRWLGFSVAGLALVPYTLGSHAAGLPVGRAAAVANGWLHFVAASIWTGGLLALLIGLILATRGVDPDRRRAVYAVAIPRFSTLAIASFVVMTLTGIYSSWLQLGELRGLYETDYGLILLLKLALIVPLLVLGGLNLMVIGPHMRRAVRAGGHFGRAVLAEAVVGIAIFLVVGLLVGLPTARDTLAGEAAGTIALSDPDAGGRATLDITPGEAGFNRYVADLDLAPGRLEPGTDVILRLAPEDGEGRTRQIELSPLHDLASHAGGQAEGATGGRFQASGAELSSAGEWRVQLTVRRPDAPDWRAADSLVVAREGAEPDIADPPPRLAGLPGVPGVMAGGLAVVATVLGLRWPGGRRRARLITVCGIGLSILSIGLLTLALTM